MLASSHCAWKTGHYTDLGPRTLYWQLGKLEYLISMSVVVVQGIKEYLILSILFKFINWK